MTEFSISVNINFLNEATTEQKEGIGLIIGGGYEYIATSFDFYEYSPFIQAGFRIDNVRVMYQFKTARNLHINHSITLGVHLDL